MNIFAFSLALLDNRLNTLKNGQEKTLERSFYKSLLGVKKRKKKRKVKPKPKGLGLLFLKYSLRVTVALLLSFLRFSVSPFLASTSLPSLP